MLTIEKKSQLDELLMKMSPADITLLSEKFKVEEQVDTQLENPQLDAPPSSTETSMEDIENELEELEF